MSVNLLSYCCGAGGTEWWAECGATEGCQCTVGNYGAFRCCDAWTSSHQSSCQSAGSSGKEELFTWQ